MGSGPRIHIVRLSEDRLRLAESIGRRRQNGKEAYPSTRNLHGNSPTSLPGHILGAAGELAVAQWISQDIDTTRRRSGDRGRDFRIDGWRIDVQTTIYEPAELKFDSNHPFSAEIAVLVRRKENRVDFELIGWILREDFRRLCRPKDYGYGMRDVVGPAQLRDIDDLVGFCTTNEAPTAR